MKKRVLGISGSPRRNGNTDTLVQRILAGAASVGAETRMVYLSELDIHPCQACMYCIDHGNCVQQDDMMELYDLLRQCDSLVLGSPIYMWQMTAQTKLFVDRLFALYTNNVPPVKSKNNLLLFVHGQKGQNAYREYCEQTRNMLQFLGIHISQIVIGDNLGQKDNASKDQPLLNRMFELGVSLVQQPETIDPPSSE